MAASSAQRERREGGLEVEQDLRFQRRMWRIERIGWGIMCVILAGAAAGLFGHGPLSRATIHVDARSTAPQVTVEYERFARAHSPIALRITVAPTESPRTMTIWFPSDYLSDVEVGRITPEPGRAELASGGIRYQFPAQEGPLTLHFQSKAVRIGRLSGSFRLNDAPPVTFQQFIYP